MFSKDEFIKKQEELDIEMGKIWESPFFDGITDYDMYCKAPLKILWILKEPNNAGKNSQNGGNQREFHKDVRDYEHWQASFCNIIRVAYGILVGKKEYKEIPPINTKECMIEEDGDEFFVLDEIAIINVNKSGGGNVTPQGKLDIEYKREGVKDFLFKQINFIDPHIIINSHGVYQFFKDQVGNNEIKQIYGEQYSKIENRLIIWTSHPNRAPKESYCNNILKIVREYYL
jgi:hypothetical protein